MREVFIPSRLVRDARDLAQVLLADLPQRWRHTVGVARRAEAVTVTVAGDDADVLVASAWLHDIGYAAPLRDTGFHPLDGARLLTATGWSMRLSGLVAHHSEAMVAARVRGLEAAMSAIPQERSAVADALTFADQTVGPDGRVMTLEDRMSDMLRRHGPQSPNAIAHPTREPLLRAAVQRVVQRLAAADLPAGYTGLVGSSTGVRSTAQGRD
jgi:hypothetical protein